MSIVKNRKKFQDGCLRCEKSLDGETIETVANETARAWKIGYGRQQRRLDCGRC